MFAPLIVVHANLNLSGVWTMFFFPHLRIWPYMAHEYGFHVGRRGFFGTIPLPSRCHRCNSAKIHRCWSLGNIGIKGALFSNGYGSIPMKIPFLGGWTSIYQLFWCELQGDRVFDPSPNQLLCTTVFGDIWRFKPVIDGTSMRIYQTLQ